MYLSVTPNAVLDRAIFIDAFQPGTYMQARREVYGVGGKGLDASVALSCLNQPTIGLHCAAGRAGQALQAHLARFGVGSEAVWVDGETRTANILVESQLNRHSHIFTGGLTLTTSHVAAFMERLSDLLKGACFMLTGGTLPPGMSADSFGLFVRSATLAGIPSLVDSFGQPMLLCLSARPAVVKMNRDEFKATFNLPCTSTADLQSSAQQVFHHFNLPALVVTCGAEGLLACTPSGNLWARAPEQVVVSAAGAGDAASGAIAWRLALGESWPDVLLWAAAVSAASVLTEGTSEVRLEDARALLPTVTIEPY